MTADRVVTHRGEPIQEPETVKFLLSDPRAAWFWLIPRLWLGWQWLDAGRHKISNPDWVDTGVAVRGFWERAVAIPETGRPPITFDWYRSFLQAMLDAEAHTFMAPMVAWGEVIVGIALLAGAVTGIAAFFGALMNWNFMMAGTASSNPVLLMVAIGLVMAWKVAGLVGLDKWLLPSLGTPWRARDRT